MSQVNYCRLCSNQISSQYGRNIYGDSFKSLSSYLRRFVNYDQTDGKSHLICQFCFNKLKKLEKIEWDIDNKVKKLAVDRDNLVDAIRKLNGQNSTKPVNDLENLVPETPQKVQGKRKILTPSPKKSAKKVASFTSPAKQRTVLREIQPKSPRDSPFAPPFSSTPVKHLSSAPVLFTPNAHSSLLFTKSTSHVDVATQTKKPRKILFETSNEPLVKATVNYKSQTKARVITTEPFKGIVKAIADRRNLKMVAKIIFSNSDLQDKLENLFLAKLQKQCIQVCSTNKPSVLRGNNINNFTVDEIINEWKVNAELLYKTLTTIALKNNASTTVTEVLPAVCLSGCTLLRARNKHMSLLHKAIGLTLDHGGATDETISILHSFGASVSTSAVHRQVRKLTALNKSTKQAKYIAEVKAEKTESSVSSVCEDVSSVCEDVSVEGEDVSSVCEDMSPVCEDMSSVCEDVSSVCEDMSSVFEDVSSICEDVSSVCEDVSSVCEMVSVTSPVENKALNVNPVSALLLDASVYGINDFSAHISKLIRKDVPSQQIPIFTVNGDILKSVIKLILQGNVKEDIGMRKKHFVNTPSFEIIGDNFDLTINPTHMTANRQRKSLHWFLNIAVKKRVLSTHLPDDKPKANLNEMSNSCFLPSASDYLSLEKDLSFHISKCLVQYIEFLKPLEKSLSPYIDHPYMKECSKKSEYLLSDLLDESENSSDGMIRILKTIHNQYVPHLQEENIDNCGKVVFGGDVLTNERAYSAQLAMRNGETEYEKLGGVIHRPEGLHRQMNLLQIIFQWFYKEKSSSETGTLRQLRNLINRRDVSGEKDCVKTEYRHHFEFVQDTLDAHIVAAAVHHFGLSSLNEKPTKNKPPEFGFSINWVLKQSKLILRNYVLVDADLNVVKDQIEFQDNMDRNIQDMKIENGKYQCSNCHKIYSRVGSLKNHMQSKHEWRKPETVVNETIDEAAKHRSSFMKASLLLRDTEDAYKMGDGERVFRNAKFEILYSDALNHTKYRLWLWRMLAFEQALLTSKQAFEYKWNISTNLKGGVGRNIPNDNLVEIQVKTIKKKLKAQGSNVSFESAKVVCQTVQFVDEVRSNLRKLCDIRQKSGIHFQPKKQSDVEKMATALSDAEFFCLKPGRKMQHFNGVKDPLESIDPCKFHTWMKLQKEELLRDQC